MRILLLEPFYASSHRQWVDGLIASSNHDIDLIKMDGRHWKWRMEHSAVHFASEIVNLEKSYDLIIGNDLINIAVLRGLLASSGTAHSWYNRVPLHVYFHENQITYPWSESDQDVALNRDVHYGWINYLSCLAADGIIFNSLFHQYDFLKSLPIFLSQFPDDTPTQKIKSIAQKCHTLHVGLTLTGISDNRKPINQTPTILWNHRWEYDKNPETFFHVLFQLADENIAFNVIICGEQYKRYPKIFDMAKSKLGERIVHFGYAKSREEYLSLLAKSDILPVTSNQDFFGISAIEAIAAGCYPLLPDRLAFSEHLQVANKLDYYYGSDEYLLIKLRKLINSHPNDTTEVRAHVLKYDWNKMIVKYDAHFEESYRS